MMSGARVACTAFVGMGLMLTLAAGCSDTTEPADTKPPAAVSNLVAVSPSLTSITLRWTAPADKGSSGGASTYDVRYSTTTITAATWSAATQVSGEPKPGTPGKADSLVVNGLLSDTYYYFALKSADKESNWSDLSNVAGGKTASPPDVTPPAAVQDLAAGTPTEHTIHLTWTAPGDDGNVGTASQYDLRYSTSPITEANWSAALTAGTLPSPKAAGSHESVTVTQLASDSTYYFALKTADEKANWSPLSNVVSAKTLHEYAWSPLGNGMTAIVNALIVFNGQLIAGGSFVQAGDANVHYIASWDGNEWSALGTGMGNTVLALAIFDGQLIAAGQFTTAGGAVAYRIAAWNGSSWSPLGSGLNDVVLSLCIYKGQLIAGGRFTLAGEDAASCIAAWDGSSWSPLGSGLSGPLMPQVMSLTVYNGLLIAGGNFMSAGTLPVSNIAAWNGTSWSALGAGTNSYVTALSTFNSSLIAGGAFTTAGTEACNYIASWDGAAWHPLGTGMNGSVAALIPYDNKLYAGGWFSMAGEAGSNVVSWDGSSWSAIGIGMSNTAPNRAIVYALTLYDGRLVAGGWFSHSGTVIVNNIAIWTN